jgi:hypothetical protein
MVASMRIRRLPVALLLSAGPVVLAACGSDGDGGAGADPATPASGEEGATGEEVRPSPIEEFMGLDPNRRTEMSEDELQQQREVEERIVECMRAEGFEYVAQDPSSDPSGLSVVNALSPDEFAAQYGYGISTIDVRAQLDQARAEDPNTAILDGMSEAARREYFAALNGEAAAAEKYGEPPPAAPDARPGCRPQAEEAVFGSLEKPPLPADISALVDEIGALRDQVRRDPRVDAAAAAWGDCMADAGHPELVHPDDPQTEIARRLWQLHGLELPTDLIEPEGRTRPGVNAPGVPLPRGGQEPDPAVLAELRQYEVAVALADRGCRVAYDEVVREVRDEVERGFIEDHRAEMERYRDQVALAGEGR